MLRFLIHRLFSMTIVLFVVSVLTFLIFEKMPNGNPALRMAGRTATAADIAAIEQQYGFNRPIWVQYLRTMKEIFTGQIASYTTQLNVMSQIKQDFPVTLSLVIGAFVIWFAVAVLLGLIGGYRAGRSIDTVITTINFAGISAPVFVIGDLLIYLLGFKAHLFPSSGYVPLTVDPIQWAYHLLLPWISLAILYIGVYSQVLRSSVVDALGEDYVRTAKAKGLSGRQIALRHVLRTSLIPIVSLSGLDIAGVLGGGAILTEAVFNLPGIGYYAYTSIQALDVPPVLVIVMLGAFAVVLFSAIADILYALLDPRIRAANA